MKFTPKEVLLSPVTLCNLSCAHCSVERTRKKLPVKAAVRFLKACVKSGVRRVGFTGGEPFLYPQFLFALTREAVTLGLYFDRVMTNGVWFKDKVHLKKTLSGLFNAGYDGDLCVSVDAFHKQPLKKLEQFIRASIDIWRRPDIISIASVKGSRDEETEERLTRLADLLGARSFRSRTGHSFIIGKDLFIKIDRISLSPVGKASRLRASWDGGPWFLDDYCKGPGHVFLVMPDGSVKPCCGYSSDSPALTVGNIYSDTPRAIIKKARKDPFLKYVFEKGLGSLRVKLEKRGVVFPGKSSSICAFCNHLLSHPDLLKLI